MFSALVFLLTFAPPATPNVAVPLDDATATPVLATIRFDTATPETVLDKDYSLSIHLPYEIDEGTLVPFLFTITPKAPWELKTNTPFTLMWRGSEGLSMHEPKLFARDFIDTETPQKTLKSSLLATAPGPQHITAQLFFFLCKKEICQRYQETFKVHLMATALRH